MRSGLGLANSKARPRFALDLREHFLPRLSEDDQRRIERLLLALARGLDPEKDWRQSLLIAEMLVGVAGEDTLTFMPGFLERREDRPAWQVQLLRAFHSEMKQNGALGRLLCTINSMVRAISS